MKLKKVRLVYGVIRKSIIKEGEREKKHDREALTDLECFVSADSSFSTFSN